MGFLPDLSLADVVVLLLLAVTVGAFLVFSGKADRIWRPLLLRRMIDRAGGKLDPASDPLLGERLAAAARACSHCRQHGECQAMLDTYEGNDIPEYCPNRRWISSLAG